MLRKRLENGLKVRMDILVKLATYSGLKLSTNQPFTSPHFYCTKSGNFMSTFYWHIFFSLTLL